MIRITSGNINGKRIFLTAARGRNSGLVHPPQSKKTKVLVIAKYTFEFGLTTLFGATEDGWLVASYSGLEPSKGKEAKRLKG